MSDVFQTYERTYLSTKRFPQFFEVDVQSSMKVFKCGSCYPLSGRDENGCKIVLIRMGQMDLKTNTTYDYIRLFCYTLTVLLQEEETQIAGLVAIFDFANAGLQHILSPMDLLDFMKFVNSCGIVRKKRAIFMNFPSFGNIFLTMLKSLLSKKLKSRLFIIKNLNELQKLVNPKLLPKEYGGIKPEAEMMQDFLDLRDHHKESLQKLLSFKLDWSRIPHEKIFWTDADEKVGSFRRLEID